MRPIPWLLRTGLFAVGFGIGLSHSESTPPRQPVVIELQVVLPDSPDKLSPRETVSEMSLSGQANCPTPLQAGLKN